MKCASIFSDVRGYFEISVFEISRCDCILFLVGSSS